MSSSISHSENPPQRFVPAIRLQHSFVAAREKQILTWLAQQAPAWMYPDHLTLLGFVSQCLVGVCYALARFNSGMLVVGIAFLAMNWLGDSLDGTLARVRQRQRPRYGFYVDHISDTIAAFFLMAGLAASGYIHPLVSLGMLIAFLMLSIESYLATYTLGEFRLSYWKFGPTEIRILLAVGNIALLRHSTIQLLSDQFLLFDLGGVIAIAGMAAMLVLSAAAHTRQLCKEEKIG